MPGRVKAVIGLVFAGALASIVWSTHYPGQSWLRFLVYLAVVLLSSGLKVALPEGEGTMSLNFPFILLAIAQHSPAQALALAALSVFAQCRVRVKKLFTFVQIAFNICNAVTATAAACLTYVGLVGAGLASAPSLALASTAYFFASTVPVALVIAWSKKEPAFPLWKAHFLWYLPFYFVGGVLAAIANYISVHFGWATSLLLVPMVYTVYRSYVAQMARMKERQQHLEDTEALHLRTIEGLAMAIEAKDQGTHDHLFRVRAYVAEIAMKLELPKLEMQALMTAAFLHDIGKLAVPEQIINKPGRLTPEEFEKMKIHPVVGADILQRVRFPYPVVPIVRSHHEWWNGKGYPDGLAGEEIPIGARILTVVDCFDALASDRPYRKAMSIDDALAIVRKMSGTQFDPAIVAILDERYVELERRAREEGERFGALDTEVEVTRGKAPGAGFEQNSAEPASSEEELKPTAVAAAAASSLDLIAEASEEAQVLFEMSQSMGSSLGLNETVSVMASRLHRLLHFECCVLYLRNEEELVAQYADGESARLFSQDPTKLGDGVSGWVAQSGKPILNGNPELEPSYVGKKGSGTGLGSALSIPLFDLKRGTMAVLTLYAVEAAAFSRDHLRILQAMESKFSMALENVLRAQESGADAETDLLTNLPKARRLFLQLEAEVSRAQRSAGKLTVIVCDLNSFKAVNEERGQLAGSMLLRSVARQFRSCCRPYDIVARMGGDEFVFLIPGLDEEGAPQRSEAILSAVASGCAESGAGVELSASLGVATYPKDGESAESLLAVAGRRMYLHKQAHYEGLKRAAAEALKQAEGLKQSEGPKQVGPEGLEKTVADGVLKAQAEIQVHAAAV